MRLSDEHSIGKPCPTCKRPITRAIQKSALESRQEHARQNVLKRKRNRNVKDTLGRPQQRNDQDINALGAMGLNASEIAKIVGYSRRTVARALVGEHRSRFRKNG